jgi:hypothetical protein
MADKSLDALQISGASPSPGTRAGSTVTSNDPVFGDPLRDVTDAVMATEAALPLDKPFQSGTNTRPVIYRANLKKGTPK